MRITAIGGGDKTPAIKATLESLPTERTNVLIIPTAASTEVAYNRKVTAIKEFFGDLGVTTSVLHEFNNPPSPDRIQHELGQAALYYTIGGNTPHLMRTLRGYGIDESLKSHIEQGKPHAGTSAGALLPFEIAHTNPSPKPSKEEWDFSFVDTLSVIPGSVATAHANQYDPTPYGTRAETRMEHLRAHMPVGKTGYAIENGAALLINGDALTIISAVQDAGVYRIDDSGSTQRLLTGACL